MGSRSPGFALAGEALDGSPLNLDGQCDSLFLGQILILIARCLAGLLG